MHGPLNVKFPGSALDPVVMLNNIRFFWGSVQYGMRKNLV
jgi:hypothetical protein